MEVEIHGSFKRQIDLYIPISLFQKDKQHMYEDLHVKYRPFLIS